jgi:hypothetical protein
MMLRHRRALTLVSPCLGKMEEMREAISRYLSKIEMQKMPVPAKEQLPEYVAKVRPPYLPDMLALPLSHPHNPLHACS